MKDDRLYLDHILGCIARLEEVRDEGRTAFDTNWRSRDAVYRELQTMAEATQRLSDDVKERHPEIPWRKVAGLRNLLTHGYLSGPDDDIVWESLHGDLDELKRVVASEAGD
jgi:uncharacterized protein with HEPN domain